MTGEPKRTASVAPALLQLDIEHGRLDRREGVLLGALLVEVAGDGGDPVAGLALGAAEDGGVGGEADAGVGGLAAEGEVRGAGALAGGADG